MESDIIFTAVPDGGWGWIIVFVVFIGNGIMDGCIGSYGIFYPEIMREFGSGPVVTSLAGSLLPAVYMMSSPLVGYISVKYGSRPVCFVGGCIGAVGLILASVSTSISLFTITFGVIVGIGISMNYLPGMVITNTYFDKKRGIASGIVCSGAGFGVFILAPVFQLLLMEYGWRGTMLITAGIFMQLCVCSTVMRPLGVRKKISDELSNHTDNVNPNNDEHEPMLTNNHQRELQNGWNLRNDNCHIVYETDYSASGSDAEIVRHQKPSQKDPLARIRLSDRSASDNALSISKRHSGRNNIDNMATKSLQEIPNGTSSKMHIPLTHSQFLHPLSVLSAQSLQHIINENGPANADKHKGGATIRESLRFCRATTCDISIFRNRNYVPLLLGGVLIQMGQFIPNTFLPEYCFTVGLDGSQMSIIIAVYGAVNIFGRISAGCLANVQRIDALWLCNVGMLMCGIGCALLPLCTTFTSLCLFAVYVGYFIGYFPPLQIIIMVEYLGMDNLPSALGFLQMAKGPAALIGPPIAGLVYQYSHSYAISIVFAAILFLLSAVIQSLVPVLNMCSKTKQKTKLNADIEILVN